MNCDMLGKSASGPGCLGGEGCSDVPGLEALATPHDKEVYDLARRSGISSRIGIRSARLGADRKGSAVSRGDWWATTWPRSTFAQNKITYYPVPAAWLCRRVPTPRSTPLFGSNCATRRVHQVTTPCRSD